MFDFKKIRNNYFLFVIVLLTFINLLSACNQTTPFKAAKANNDTLGGVINEFKFDESKGCYLSNRIIGGQLATQDTTVSSHVLYIEAKSKTLKDNQILTIIDKCSATLIESKTLLTAGHCIPKNTESISIYAAPSLKCSSGFNKNLILTAKNFTHHPNFEFGSEPKTNRPDFDLAIIHLESELPESYKPVELFKSSINNLKNQNSVSLIQAGYGKSTSLESNNFLPELKWIRTTPQSITTETTFNTSVKINLLSSLNLFAIRTTSTKGICQGDSGGPIFVDQQNNLYLLGVTSYISNSLCEKSLLSFYSAIEIYAPWIEDTLTKLNQ